MVLLLEVPLASIAIVLVALSWRTMRAIKHLSVGKSFWVPILSSGIFFFAGSVMAILSDLGFSFTIYTAEAISVSRLVALCSLVGAVYTYSRKITKTLVEQLPVPVRPTEIDFNEVAETQPLAIEKSEHKIIEEEVDCKHELGYLRSLPRRAPIPEECSGCHQIIDCKFSFVEKVESTAKPVHSR